MTKAMVGVLRHFYFCKFRTIFTFCVGPVVVLCKVPPMSDPDMSGNVEKMLGWLMSRTLSDPDISRLSGKCRGRSNMTGYDRPFRK